MMSPCPQQFPLCGIKDLGPCSDCASAWPWPSPAPVTARLWVMPGSSSHICRDLNSIETTSPAKVGRVETFCPVQPSLLPQLLYSSLLLTFPSVQARWGRDTATMSWGDKLHLCPWGTKRFQFKVSPSVSICLHHSQGNWAGFKHRDTQAQTYRLCIPVPFHSTEGSCWHSQRRVCPELHSTAV